MSSLVRSLSPVFALLLVIACSPVQVPATDGGNIDAGDVFDGAVVIDAISIDAVPPDPCTQASISIMDAEACYREAFCSMYVRCYGMFASVDECLSYNFGRLNPEVMFNRFRDAINAGKVIYDAAATAVCFAAMRETECALLNDGPPNAACDEVFTGTVAPGANCYMTEECLGSNAECNDGDCQLQCCLGSCEAAAALYESCADGKRCVEGAHCVTLPTSGQFCQAGDLSSPCNSSYECDTALWCDMSGATGSCAADFPANSSCSDDRQCPAPQICVGDDASTGIGNCAEVSTLSAPCDNECFGPYYCHAIGDAIGDCRELPGIGGNCAIANRCAGTLRCNGTTNLCVARVALDGVCQVTNDCELGLICDADLPGGSPPGQCKNPVPNSSACDRDDQCVSQICAGVSGSLSCQAYANCY